VKTDVSIGFGDDGITWEKDPAKHRKMAKDLAPSFSVKSMKALEPTMHRYVDAFVQKMKTLGDQDGGIELKMACLLPLPSKSGHPKSLSGSRTNLYTWFSGPTGLHWIWRPIWLPAAK
jgi:hypothetical protein